MPTLIITRGLPGSGKSTWARSWVEQEPNVRARVNRDDLRDMLHNGVFIGHSPADGVVGTELSVVSARSTLIRKLLLQGKDVVCDDTNLPNRVARELRSIAASCRAQFEVHDLRDVPLDLCLARNAQRSGRRRLPDGKIRDLHRKYVAGSQHLGPLPEEPAPPSVPAYVPLMHLPGAYIVDVDGTIALPGSRDPYDMTRVGEDRPNTPVVDLVRTLYDAGYDIVFCSGRKQVARADTERWIGRYLGITGSVLYLRADDDNRRDAIVKLEIFDQQIRHRWRVRGVIDDRRQVVEAWRSIGLTVFQVAPGDF